jgi:hypothetical protein
MWVRAVAAAVVAVAWCAGTAQAAQYAEVWNPPEAKHAPKKVHVSSSAGKKAAVRGAAAGKNKRQTVEPKKASLHAAQPVKSHPGLAAKSVPGKAVKTAHIKGVTGKPVKVAHMKGVNGAPTKAVKTAHAKAGHVQTAMHSKPQKVAIKPASTKTAAAMANSSAKAVPTVPAATMANTAANSAGGSRDLPPILH